MVGKSSVGIVGEQRAVALLSIAALALLTCSHTASARALQTQGTASSSNLGLEKSSYDFDIPEGNLVAALEKWSQVTRLKYVSSGQVLRGLRTTGLSGAFTANSALERLLKGTHLQFGITGKRTITIFDPHAALSAHAQATLDTINVDADRNGTGSSTTMDTTRMIGTPPPAYAGGQVADGGQLGLLGNRSLMNTPFNITSYTSKTIADQQAQTVGDVLMNDPSVRSVYPRGGNTDEFMIRGFTLYNREIGFNGLYGLVPFSSISLEGIERVEVLKGPNALLNGMAISGSVGGGINLVPQRAGTDPLNRLTLGYISDGQLGVHADVARRYSINGGNLGIRGNIAYSSGDTSLDNSELKSQVGTLGLDYSYDRFRFDADIRYQKRDVTAPTQLLFPGTIVPAVVAPSAGTNFAQPWTYIDSTELMGMARAEYDITDNTTLFAAVGARSGDYDSLQSNWTLQNAQGLIRATPFYNYSEYKALSYQAGIRSRIQTGPVRHQVSLIASSVYFDTYTQSASLPPAIFSNLYSPVSAAKPPSPSYRYAPPSNYTDLASLAVADTMSILDERVQLTVGVRRQQVKVANFNAGVPSSNYNESAVTPAVGLVIRATPWLSLYANYIEGLSQGPQAPMSAVNAGEVFPPFITEQKEVGIKADFGQIGMTLSAFEINQPSSFTNPTTMVFSVDGNQQNRGIEFMTYGNIVDNVRVLGGVAYTESELTATAGGVNNGKTGIGVPKWQANAGVEWDAPFLSGFTLSGRAIYTSSQYLNAPNTQEIPEWVRYDVGARYAFEANGTPVTLRFNIENLLNEGYWASASRGGYKQGAARTYLLSATIDF